MPWRLYTVCVWARLANTSSTSVVPSAMSLVDRKVNEWMWGTPYSNDLNAQNSYNAIIITKAWKQLCVREFQVRAMSHHGAQPPALPNTIMRVCTRTRVCMHTHACERVCVCERRGEAERALRQVGAHEGGGGHGAGMQKGAGSVFGGPT